MGIESSLEAVAHALRTLGLFDLVALQEIGERWCMGAPGPQAALLAEAIGLPHHCFAGALSDNAGGGFGLALLSAWPLEAVRRTPLPRQADEQRVLLSARVMAPTPLRAFNTHLSVRPEERLAQARVVRAALETSAEPTVLFGDLNMGPDDPARRLAQGPLTDCFDAVGEGPPETFSVVSPRARIDYIAVGRGLRPVRCSVARSATASDHFVLVARLAP